MTTKRNTKRYYITQYGYYWSLNRDQFLDALLFGSNNGYIDLSNYKLLKGKVNEYLTKVYHFLDAEKEDFKYELIYQLNNK